MVKFLEGLQAEIIVWETEEDREEGLSFVEKTKALKVSEDIAELMGEVDELACENEAVELDILDAEEKFICTLYHVSVDGIEYLYGTEGKDVDEIAKKINLLAKQ